MCVGGGERGCYLPVAGSFDDLGRNVLGRAAHGVGAPRHRFAQPEVRQLRGHGREKVSRAKARDDACAG